jgi:tetratricopeptide (TPR) repeat protein
VSETPERVEQELDLQLGIGSALSAVKGWSVPEVGQAFGRASELCRQIGSTPHLLTALFGLGGFYNIHGELRRAYELSRQALPIAEEKGDASFLVWGHYGRGILLSVMGEYTSARSHLERAISLYDPARRESYRAVYPVYDPGVLARGWAALNLCLLGYPDQALDRSRQALVLAREPSHLFSLGLTSGLSARVHKLRREGEARRSGFLHRLAGTNEVQLHTTLICPASIALLTNSLPLSAVIDSGAHRQEQASDSAFAHLPHRPDQPMQSSRVMPHSLIFLFDQQKPDKSYASWIITPGHFFSCRGLLTTTRKKIGSLLEKGRPKAMPLPVKDP